MEDNIQELRDEFRDLAPMYFDACIEDNELLARELASKMGIIKRIARAKYLAEHKK